MTLWLEEGRAKLCACIKSCIDFAVGEMDSIVVGMDTGGSRRIERDQPRRGRARWGRGRVGRRVIMVGLACQD